MHLDIVPTPKQPHHYKQKSKPYSPDIFFLSVYSCVSTEYKIFTKW